MSEYQQIMGQIPTRPVAVHPYGSKYANAQRSMKKAELAYLKAARDASLTWEKKLDPVKYRADAAKMAGRTAADLYV